MDTVQDQPSRHILDKSKGKDNDGKTRLLATGGILGAIAASSCCILPLVLFSLGISGAWISNLTALYPYKPYFITLTLALLAYGFYLTYRKPDTSCADGAACARPLPNRIVKVALWAATALIIAAILFPYAVPYLLGNLN